VKVHSSEQLEGELGSLRFRESQNQELERGWPDYMGRSEPLEGDVIEFSSDGVRDSLTGALAPARFNELLQSELAMANRDQRLITVLSLRLKNISTKTSVQRDRDLIHQLLKSMADHLSPLLRSGDQLCRISEDGFWILMRAHLSDATTASKRLFPNGFEVDPGLSSSASLASSASPSTSRSLDQGVWRLQYCESEPGESLSSWIQRIDHCHFSG